MGKKVVKKEAKLVAKKDDVVTADDLEEQVAAGGSGLKALVELIKRSQIDWKTENERVAARHALRRSFTSLLERGELRRRIGLAADERAALDWLDGLYEAHITDLISWTWNDRSSSTEQVAALRTLLWFACREYLREDESRVIMDEDGNPKAKSFNLRCLTQLIQKGMECEVTAHHLVLRTLRDEYLQAFVDFQLYYSKSLGSAFNAVRKTKTEELRFKVNSAFVFLCATPLPKLKPLKPDDMLPMMIEQDPVMEMKLRKVGPLRKAFQAAWISFLRLRTVHGATLKAVLTKLPNVIPSLSEPLMLSDFLSEAFSMSASSLADTDEIPLLALSSLFLLVRDYGLDYPRLYDRLYELVRPSLFFSNKRESFCVLLDACLKSPMIPAYIVAAFCKKLARVALMSTPSAALFALAEIYNMLRRHPNVVFLIHRTDKKMSKSQLLHKSADKELLDSLSEIKEASRRLAMGLDPAGPRKLVEDPFDMDQVDPAKSNAMESSLWEIETLQHHYCPTVANMAKSVFDHDLTKDRLTKPELPLADFIVSYDDLYQQEARMRNGADVEGKKRVKVDAPLNARKPDPANVKPALMFL